jgi:hypothetical protein
VWKGDQLNGVELESASKEKEFLPELWQILQLGVGVLADRVSAWIQGKTPNQCDRVADGIFPSINARLPAVPLFGIVPKNPLILCPLDS